MTVKSQRVSALADYIEHDSKLIFSMGTLLSRHPCGSVACIAGHAVVMMLGDEVEAARNLVYIDGSRLPMMMTMAAEWLGLDVEQAIALFTPEGFATDRYTRKAALRTLRHLAETGEVRWDV